MKHGIRYIGWANPGEPNAFEADLPWPPSVNDYWKPVRFKNGRIGIRVSKKGAAYKKTVQAICSGLSPMKGELMAFITLRPPDKGRRDFDNFQKAPMDALVDAHVMEDDRQIRHAVITFAEPIKGGVYSVKLLAAELVG